MSYAESKVGFFIVWQTHHILIEMCDDKITGMHISSFENF
jgi:hypothetical protein